MGDFYGNIIDWNLCSSLCFDYFCNKVYKKHELQKIR